MNGFILVLVFFAFTGLLDKIIGGKFGLAAAFDAGLAKMGTVSVTTAGIYCIGVTVVEGNAQAIARWTASFPIDPSILIGSFLAPDLGGVPIAAGIAGNPAIGAFAGVIVSSCLGQLICFQLPVVFPIVEEKSKSQVMQGFLRGISTIPVGLVAGGLALGLPLKVILLNTGVIIVLCVLLSAGFKKAPQKTEHVMRGFGEAIRVLTLLMFGLVAAGVFIPAWNVAEPALLREIMVILFRMLIVICGGLVLSELCARVFKKQFSAIAAKIHTNDFAVIGLLLSCINSIAMAPLFEKMDDNGKRINAAFAVSGAYLLGGQMAFISSVADQNVFNAYMISKVTAGVAAVIITVAANNRQMKSVKKF